MQIQQGDVLFVQVNAIPDAARKLKTKTIAEGESTGHAHVAIADDVCLYERDGVLYVSAPTGAEIKHQEHAPVTLPPGDFQVGIVQEYDYDRMERARVID